MSDANPWGISAAEAAALDALIEHGSQKGAAYALGLSDKTINAHMGSVRLKMNVRTRVHYIVKWDRWRRAIPKGQS